MARCRSIAPILPVRDVGASLALYNRLGFTVDGYEVDGRLIYGFAERDAFDFHVTLTANLDPTLNTSAVYLVVDDVDALYAEWQPVLREARLGAPADRDWGMREMTYIDPDGNLLRIGHHLEPTGRRRRM